MISGNTVLNSADDVSGTDRIRLNTSSGVACNDNVVEFNTATDNQVVKTQRYGLNIASPDCHRTVVQDNNFLGNLVGAINDTATDTIYVDTTPPTAPPPDSVVTVADITYNWKGGRDSNKHLQITVTVTDAQTGAPVEGITVARGRLPAPSVGPSTEVLYLAARIDSGCAAERIASPQFPPGLRPP